MPQDQVQWQLLYTDKKASGFHKKQGISSPAPRLSIHIFLNLFVLQPRGRVSGWLHSHIMPTLTFP